MQVDAPHSLDTEPAHDPFSFGRVLHLLRRRPLTVFACLVAAVGLGVTVLGSRTARYRATATVLLDQSSGNENPMMQMLPGGGGSRAAADLAILRSRAIALEVAQAPTRASAAEPPPDTRFPMHLGLTTLVEDSAYDPVATLRYRALGSVPPQGRLRAKLAAVNGAEDIQLELEILSSKQLRMRRRLGDWSHWKTLDWEEGVPFEAQGVRLLLDTEGNCEGRVFRIRRMSLADAVSRVQAGLTVAEREVNSGVLELTFEDSDPQRASETANALAMSFISAARWRGERRASGTVDFIRTQLAERSQALSEAELEVTRLQAEEPGRIDLEETGSALISQLRELEKTQVAQSIRRASLDESIEALRGGDAYAVSRLDPQFLDPASAGLVRQMARLESERDMPSAVTHGQRHMLLRARIDRLQADMDGLDLQAQWLAELLDSVAAGDRNAFSRFGTGQGGQILVDRMTSILIEGLSRRRIEREELLAEITGDHPRMVALEESIVAIEGRIVDQAKARLGQVRSAMNEYAGLITQYTEALTSAEGETVSKIEAAELTTRTRVISHLENRRLGLEDQAAAVTEEIERIELQLASLPEERLRLAGPMRRLEAAGEVVSFLTKSLHDAQIVGRASVKVPELIDPAVAPRARHSPRATLILGVSALGGLLLGLMVAARREARSGPAVSTRELERTAKLPILSTIPEFDPIQWNRQRDLLSFIALRDAPDSPAAAAYRKLAERLLATRRRLDRCQVVGLSSSVIGEGITTVAHNLALALSSAGNRVLLVDGQIAAPGLHEAFGVPATPGFSDVLAGRRSWRRVVRPTAVEGLGFLPAGKAVELSSLNADPEKIERGMKQLRRDFEFIIIDLAPVDHGATEMPIVSELDLVLLVYDGRLATQPDARHAHRAWRKVTERPCMAVFNGYRESAVGHEVAPGHHPEVAAGSAAGAR